ncbi:MAG: FtsQ-type POTRA domain-containing protein [Actinobacteria bacterium]|nr:FtsQ-type POTRA domain-containing protein [Actinomycetota bacterium]
MTEPTPPKGEDVPDHVLDELKLVFGGDDVPAAPPEPPAAPAAPTAAQPAASTAPAATSTSAATSTEAKPRATIVIGGDDSLPDPVYLDDPNLEPLARVGDDDSGGRTTIVIGDDLDLSGAFDAVAVPSRSMDPRVRARRVAVKKARSRKRLLWVGLGVFVVLLAVGVLAVFSSSLFAVDRVDVQGATYTEKFDAAALQAVIDDLSGEPVLLVDTSGAEAALEQIPWIERAFVTTDFPHGVLIDIRERRPLATFQGSDGRYRVIDRDGRVLSVLDGQPIDYMLLTGPAPDSEAGELAGPPFAAAAQMVSALPPEIRSLAVSATVDATTGDLGLSLMRPAPTTVDDGTGTTVPAGVDAPGLDDPIEVRIGSSVNLDSKLARLLQQIRDGIDDVDRIDVSTDPMSVR